ncbi:MAG: ribosomal protein S18-alanine N-acetyltransferase [Bacillota bacterium]|nr:ribosomal protein S18-alanine N-acetyltransferase [Bacillota bacterium]
MHDLNVAIVPMLVDDVEAVAALEQASFEDPWPLQSFRTELELNRLANYLVARHEDRIIGYIGAWVIIDEVHITTLAVGEEYRRHGIATRLVRALLDRTCKYDVNAITLEVRPSNKSAIAFYEKLGFRVRGRRKNYYTDEDALIMTKDIVKIFGRRGEGKPDEN